MVIDRQISTSIKRSPLLIASAISLLANAAVSPCLAFGLTAGTDKGAMSCPSLGKLPVGAHSDSQLIVLASMSSKNMMQCPTFGKLDSTASPASPDATANGDQASASPQADAKPADLSPISISDASQGSNQSTAGGAADDDNAMLKTSVTKNELAPKGPLESTEAISPWSAKKSVGEKILPKASLLKKAEEVNIIPLALQPSGEETKETDKFKFNAEQQQMADLWDATLGRSQDIQFVIQKLMPNSNSGKTSGILMRLISTAAFGGMGAGMMMMPNMGGQMAMNSGSSMMYQALNGIQSTQAKKARLNETEAIMLYNIVRTTADKMVNDFRSYKKNINQLKTASSDLEDLQNMVKDAKAADPTKGVENEYTLRKAQRDVDGIAEDVKRFRQALVDLSGSEAVAKLDEQLANEVTGNEGTATAAAPAEPETPMVLDVPRQADPAAQKADPSPAQKTSVASTSTSGKGSPATSKGSPTTNTAPLSQKTKGSVASSTTNNAKAPSQHKKPSTAPRQELGSNPGGPVTQ